MLHRHGQRQHIRAPFCKALGWADAGCGCGLAARLRDCCAPGRARSAVAAGMLALAAGSWVHELSKSRNLPERIASSDGECSGKGKDMAVEYKHRVGLLRKGAKCAPVAGQLLPSEQLAAPLGDVAVLRPKTWDGDLQVQPFLDDAEPHAVELGGIRRSAAHILSVGALESVLEGKHGRLRRYQQCSDKLLARR